MHTYMCACVWWGAEAQRRQVLCRKPPSPVRGAGEGTVRNWHFLLFLPVHSEGVTSVHTAGPGDRGTRAVTVAVREFQRERAAVLPCGLRCCTECIDGAPGTWRHSPGHQGSWSSAGPLGTTVRSATDQSGVGCGLSGLWGVLGASDAPMEKARPGLKALDGAPGRQKPGNQPQELSDRRWSRRANR